MHYIRLVHPNAYDRKRGKFHNYAFKNDSDDGCASIIQIECVTEGGNSVCGHIREHYPAVTGEPPIFWVFDESDIRLGWSIEQKTSETGDICHHNIIGASNTSLRKIADKWAISDLMICINGAYRSLTLADLSG